jgi:predicted dinucleotide-binding enzyme
MKHKIVIIGSGKAGTALQTGLSRGGYDVRFAKKGQITETASWADVIVLAVPFGVVRGVARAGNRGRRQDCRRRDQCAQP